MSRAACVIRASVTPLAYTAAGVYYVCLYDVVSGVFDVVGSIATLVYPEIMLRSQVLAPPSHSRAVLARLALLASPALAVLHPPAAVDLQTR